MSIPIPTISDPSALDALLHRVVKQDTLPGVFFAAANINEIIYENQDGQRVYGQEGGDRINEKTVLHLFSQTKLVTCLAALQLLDRGLLSLDDPALIAKHCPELTKLKILKGYTGETSMKESTTGVGAIDKMQSVEKSGEEIWEEPKNAITLRMLMSHTAGLAYHFTSPHYITWANDRPERIQMLSANADVEAFTFPLVYEPGTSWKYSIGIDWVGILITRVSGTSLDAYFQKNLFEPCGIKDLSFFPKEDMKKRMMSVCSRDPKTGQLIKQEALPMGRTDNPELVGVHSGGGGLMGTLHDYLVLLQHIMRCSPNNPNPPKQPLISKESFNLLFEPTLPIKQKFARDPTVGLADVPDTSLEGHVAFMKWDTYVHPRPTTETRNHSVALSLNLEDLETGRKKGSGTWGGAAKTQHWLDPTSGLVAVCGTQLIAPNPDPWWTVYNEYERTLYDSLKI